MKNLIQIKTESKTMNVCLMQFDRLLHQNKLFHNGNGWEFVSAAVNSRRKDLKVN
jgi:hypothetical protein